MHLVCNVIVVLSFVHVRRTFFLSYDFLKMISLCQIADEIADIIEDFACCLGESLTNSKTVCWKKQCTIDAR